MGNRKCDGVGVGKFVATIVMTMTPDAFKLANLLSSLASKPNLAEQFV